MSRAGTARTTKSRGENISHFNAVRIRVVGSGNLDLEFFSLDDVISQVLTPIAMSATTNREPTVLANFQQQRASLELSTDEINEYVRVNRIIIFQKQLWTSFPQ